MTTLLHLAGAAETALAWITAAWMAASDLITVALLLTLLDRLAAAVRLTYRAGHAVGSAWFRWGLPTLLAIADGISWLLAQIDWHEVRSTLVATARTLVALAIAAGLSLRDAHRRWVGQIEWTSAPMAPTTPVAPAVNPLYPLAIALEARTSKQLKALTGSRRRCRKSELIAAWIAA